MATMMTPTSLLVTTSIVLLVFISTVACATNCTGNVTLTASESGINLVAENYVTSPGFVQSHPSPIDCEVHISAGSNSSVVVLEFTYFQMDEDRPNCTNDYMVIYDGSSTNSTRIKSFCHNNETAKFNSTNSDMTIVFHSDGLKNNNSGFTFYYYSKNKTTSSSGAANQCQSGTISSNETAGYLVSPNYPNDYPSNASCQWIIRARLSSSVIALTVLDFILQNGSCINDYVTLYDGSDTSYPIIQRMCGSVARTQFTSTGRYMAVYFHSDWSYNYKGFRLEYSSQDRSVLCGNATLSASGSPKYIFSPSYPNNYPSDIYCEWRIAAALPSHLVMLKLLDFYLEGSTSSTCVYDYLKIYDGLSVSSTVIQTVCGQSLIPQFISSGPYMTLSFSSDSSSNYRGFKLEYTSVNKSDICSNNMLSATGIPKYITSPNYPNEYPRNIDCTWRITASSSSQAVVLKLLDFHLEGTSPVCPYDNVTIYDGSSTSSPRTSLLCGQISSTEIISSGPTVIVMFHSDGSTSFSGFHIQYTSKDKSDVCKGNNLLASSGTNNLNSPNYPGLYPSNIDCEWQITTSSSYSSSVVSLVLTKLDLEGVSPYCYNDYVKIYDGPSTSSRLIETLCGNEYYKTFESTGSTMTVVFHSDGVNYFDTGFSFTYQSQYRWQSTDYSPDNTGTIVAIIVCCVAVPVLVVLFIILVRRRMAQKRLRNGAPIQNGTTTMPAMAYVANNQQPVPAPYVMMQNPQMVPMGTPYYNMNYYPPPYSYAMPPGAMPPGAVPMGHAPLPGQGLHFAGVDPAQAGAAHANMGFNYHSNSSGDVVKTPLEPDSNAAGSAPPKG